MAKAEHGLPARGLLTSNATKSSGSSLQNNVEPRGLARLLSQTTMHSFSKFHLAIPPPVTAVLLLTPLTPLTLHPPTPTPPLIRLLFTPP